MNHLTGFEENKISKKPSWTIKHGDMIFGYEVVGAAKRFFSIQKGETQREYISIIPEWIQKLIRESIEQKVDEGDKYDNSTIKAKQSEDIEIGNSKTLADISNKMDKPLSDNVGLMPDKLTNELFVKWQKMTVEERLIMLQTTDTRYIEERPGRGRQTYKYVSGNYMVLCANMAFGFLWSSNVQQWETTKTEIICMGYVETKINGELIRKYAIGQKDIAYRKDTEMALCLGDDYKAAEMDMIKKALSFYGIAKDVYGGEI